MADILNSFKIKWDGKIHPILYAQMDNGYFTKTYYPDDNSNNKPESELIEISEYASALAHQVLIDRKLDINKR